MGSAGWLAFAVASIGCSSKQIWSGDAQEIPEEPNVTPDETSPPPDDGGSPPTEPSPVPGERPQFFIGQNTPDLTVFRTEVLDADPTFPRPDGVTLYTNIIPGTCSGATDGPCDINGNVNDFARTLDEYPGVALAVGLYLSDNYAGCGNQPLRALIGRDDPDVAGTLGQQYRDELDDLIVYLRDTGRDVYLRFGYEFDGPWNCYNRDFYRAAFRYAKGRVDAHSAANIFMVWQSATYPRDGEPNFFYDFSNPAHLEDWYPGDDVVDWIGISTFAWDPGHLEHQWSCLEPTSLPTTLYERAAEFAADHDKPLMIAESSPTAYRTRNADGQTDAGCILGNFGSETVSQDALWNDWYAPYFEFVRSRNEVGAFAYINSDWEAVAQFNCAAGAQAGQPDCTDGFWGNSRIQDANTIYSRFSEAVSGLSRSTP